jgi:type I restriction enzyme S subunit
MTNLPNGWEIKRLEDLCEPGKQAIVDGPFGSNLKRSDYVDSGIPVLKIQNIKENVITLKKMDYVKPEKYQELVRHSFTEGDIVMTKLGDPLGVSAIVNGVPNGLIVADLVRIRASKIHTKFLCYQLNSPRIQKHINEQQKGTTRPRVNLAMIRELPIYTPPTDEQHKIVELLEDHLSRLDTALTDVEQAKIKAAQFRRSLLLSLMSPDYAGSSSDWTSTTLGRVCDLVAGKTPPLLESSIDGIDDSSRTIPFYKVGDMNLHSEFLCESRLYLSAKQVEDRKLFSLPIGSVVFPKAGGAIATNKKRVVTVPGPIDLNCMAAIPIEGTNPKYLSWWFQSINLSSYADGSILPQLSKGKMSEIPVDWPNLKVQEEIVLSLEQSLSKNSEAIKLAAVIEADASSLRRSLLQAAFTGQLTNEVVSV